MIVIDAQLHEPPASLDWDDADVATRSKVLTELQLAFMRAVGVDCAVLQPWHDHAWAEQLASQMPDKFSVVSMITPGGMLDGIDPEAPDIDDLIAEHCRKPTTVGLRIAPNGLPDRTGEGFRQLRAGMYDRAFAACERAGVPIFMSSSGDLAAPGEVAARFGALTVVVDHFGVPQPPTFKRGPEPFRALPELLALAVHPNIAVKFCGAPTLALQPYPYPDLWPHLHQVIEAFGVERLMWASDISRVYGKVGFSDHIPKGTIPEGLHTYAEDLHYLLDTDELSATDKEWLLGRSAQQLLHWPAALGD